MPLKSKSQLRKFGELVKQGKMSQDKFQEFLDATPNVGSLPEKVGPKKVTGLDKLRSVARTKLK